MAEDYALTRPLLRDWKTVDQGIADHVADPDPHEQYALKTAALSAFSFAAYGGLRYSGAAYPFPNIGAAWQDLDFMETLAVSTPRHFTVDTAASSLTPDSPGVYLLALALSFNHNSSNSGRITSVRLRDTADQDAGGGYQIGTGRNAEVTSTGVTMMFELLPEDIGHPFVVQIGGGDAYSAVEFTSCAYTIHSIGEYRGLLIAPAD